MRYLTLAEALVIAEAVTGIEIQTLSRASRVDLLDSALHAPLAGFGDEDFYPTLVEKAAVLAVRIAGNHPLPRRQQAARLAGADDLPRPQRSSPRGRHRRRGGLDVRHRRR